MSVKPRKPGRAAHRMSFGFRFMRIAIDPTDLSLRAQRNIAEPPVAWHRVNSTPTPYRSLFSDRLPAN